MIPVRAIKVVCLTLISSVCMLKFAKPFTNVAMMCPMKPNSTSHGFLVRFSRHFLFRVIYIKEFVLSAKLTNSSQTFLCKQANHEDKASP